MDARIRLISRYKIKLPYLTIDVKYGIIHILYTRGRLAVYKTHRRLIMGEMIRRTKVEKFARELQQQIDFLSETIENIKDEDLTWELEKKKVVMESMLFSYKQEFGIK